MEEGEKKLPLPRQVVASLKYSGGMKIVGSRSVNSSSPAACVRRAERLIAEADRLAPHPKPRGFVFKARTWNEYAAWRLAQPNPRLW
jgi:hypothetical protein